MGVVARRAPLHKSLGIYHADVPAIRQYLLHADNLVVEWRGPLISQLLVVAPVAR
jgi:hypothetical protein